MATSDAVVLTVVICFVIGLVAALAAYASGREDSGTVKALREASRFAVSDADADGRYGTWWRDGRAPGEAVFAVPTMFDRQNSRDLAERILERQGEEGAEVALRVVEAYRQKSGRPTFGVVVPDDKPTGDAS